MRATVIPYRYGLASIVGQGVICGHHGDPNPITTSRKQVLPLAKLKVGDALHIHKRETLPHKIALAVSTVKRYNKQLSLPIFAMIDTSDMLEIVRIR